MGEQGHDDHHSLCRGAQPIEDGAFAGAEGLLTRVTDEALLLPRMDTNVALARLASGRAVLIGAEYGCGVHDSPPGCVWKHAKRSMSGPPFLLQMSFTTVKWRATKLPTEHFNTYKKAHYSKSVHTRFRHSMSRICRYCALTRATSVPMVCGLI